MRRIALKLKRWFTPKRLLILLGSTLLLFLLINVGIFLAYRSRTYPNTTVTGHALGSVKYAAVVDKLQTLPILPATTQFTLADKSSSLTTADLGASVDAQKTAQYSREHRSWLPVANFFIAHQSPLYITINDEVFAKSFTSLTETYQRETSEAQIILDNGTFSIKQELDGYKLNADSVKRAVIDNLNQGKAVIELPVETVVPAQKQTDLQPTLDTLKNQQNVGITYTYQDKNKKLTPQEIGAWYIQKDGKYELSDDKIRTSLASLASNFSVKPQNAPQLLAATKEAIIKNKPVQLTFVATPVATKTLTYCTAVRGVDVSYLPGVEAKLQAVYGDARGWSLDGKLVLKKVSSGCNYTVWLSAASQMAGFGGECDAEWSCRIGSSVVLNFDRWQGASAAWNAAGGALDEYRTMVINHETGHWFGFAHKYCGGAGQAAPVMQQQSISLQGCKFNAWPLASELAALKKSQGI